MLRAAVLIPCDNEAVTNRKVVTDLRTQLPHATVYVYDDNSTDDTLALAASAGATTRHEMVQGNGRVVRRMFADIEAGAYVLVDGDDIYDAPDAAKMVRMLVAAMLDMVTGNRETEIKAAHRPGHRSGFMFGEGVIDMLSGYRVFSRLVVKSSPALSSGFDTGTELIVYTRDLRMAVRRHRDGIQGPPGRLGVEAEHLPGWDPHPADDHYPGDRGAAARLLLLHRPGAVGWRRFGACAGGAGLSPDRRRATATGRPRPRGVQPADLSWHNGLPCDRPAGRGQGRHTRRDGNRGVAGAPVDTRAGPAPQTVASMKSSELSPTLRVTTRWRTAKSPIRLKRGLTQMLRKTLLILATAGLLAAPDARAAAPGGADNGLPQVYSTTPSAMSDHYVQGRYNKDGIFVPPHYEPKAKPVFHGYFDHNKTTVKHGYFDAPKPVKPKTDQDDADQPGQR
ncbi:glycosyltransferase [Lichenicoccus roseus]|nr:glycosyltransferase [Lichenicoccus roseus]